MFPVALLIDRDASNIKVTLRFSKHVQIKCTLMIYTQEYVYKYKVWRRPQLGLDGVSQKQNQWKMRLWCGIVWDKDANEGGFKNKQLTGKKLKNLTLQTTNLTKTAMTSNKRQDLTHQLHERSGRSSEGVFKDCNNRLTSASLYGTINLSPTVTVFRVVRASKSISSLTCTNHEKYTHLALNHLI